MLQTPQSLRTNIVFVGKVNSGKSSLVNNITLQETSIVSEVAGTTTDVVRKSIEIHPLGPCVLVDTAGVGDESALSKQRLKKTFAALDSADIATFVIKTGDDISQNSANHALYSYLISRRLPFYIVCTFADEFSDVEIKKFSQQVKEIFKKEPVFISNTHTNSREIQEMMASAWSLLPTKDSKTDYITSTLVQEGDIVLLVMPQDSQAPKGRLILPQVQVIRELLDRKCICISTTPETFTKSLSALSLPPKLIITDSKIFDFVYSNKPDPVPLTSFSVLFAYYKGDGEYYLKSARKILDLNKNSRVLISECCTHTTNNEDIGRVILPNLLKNKIGDGLQIDFAQGIDFPENLSSYSLVIQCGGCMFTKALIRSRVSIAREQNIPMTNYGMAFAQLAGILDKITLPAS